MISNGMSLELYPFLSRYLIKVSRNEIKTKCAGNFLIYAEFLSLAEMPTCQKEKKQWFFKHQVLVML